MERKIGVQRRRRAGSVELTPREREVVALLALGLTNRQIGERLGIGKGTVDRHVESILLRLEVPTRTAAVVAFYGLVVR
jgi:DNA-binding NarL/FixJ family response regulator